MGGEEGPRKRDKGESAKEALSWTLYKQREEYISIFCNVFFKILLDKIRQNLIQICSLHKGLSGCHKEGPVVGGHQGLLIL